MTSTSDPRATWAPRHVPLVLASASSGRLTTLRNAGIEPTVVVSDVDEDAVVAAARAGGDDLGPPDVALLLARAKCEAVVARAARSAIVLGCDSVLELAGAVHGKPADAAEAVCRWLAMRGTSGVLHTGHWLVDDRDPRAGGTGATLGATASTTVHFAQLSNEEVETYVATGEPLGAAGAFTIDGLGGPFVSAVEGDPHNVVGLSLPLLRGLLGDIGVRWFDLVAARDR